MHRTWTAAFAVMVLMHDGYAAPTTAQDLPEAHTIIGEEAVCREIAPHRNERRRGAPGTPGAARPAALP